MAKNLLMDFDEELVTPVKDSQSNEDLTVNERCRLLETELRMIKLCLQASNIKSDSGYGDSLGKPSLKASMSTGEGNSGMQLLTPTPVQRRRPTPKPRARFQSTPAPTTVPGAATENDVSLTGNSLKDSHLAGLTGLSSLASTCGSNAEDCKEPQQKKDDARSGGNPPSRGTTKDEVSKIGSGATLRRPNITPDRYHGKTPWRDYLQHFQACKSANEWTEGQAKVFLAASLQGVALKVLGNGTCKGGKQTYTELVDSLEKRFGPGRLAENHLMELRHRRQGPKETLQELGQSIKELSALAYPELTDEGRDRLARGHFSDAIESQAIREGIFRTTPSTLEEAVRAALATESFHKIEENREGRKAKFARVLEEDPDVVFKEMREDFRRMEKNMLKAQEEMKAQMGMMSRCTPTNNRPNKTDVERIAGDVICYRCHGKGHYARNCSRPAVQKRRYQGNDQQPTQGPEGRLGVQQGQQVTKDVAERS